MTNTKNVEEIVEYAKNELGFNFHENMVICEKTTPEDLNEYLEILEEERDERMYEILKMATNFLGFSSKADKSSYERAMKFLGESNGTEVDLILRLAYEYAYIESYQNMSHTPISHII